MDLTLPLVAVNVMSALLFFAALASRRGELGGGGKVVDLLSERAVAAGLQPVAGRTGEFVTEVDGREVRVRKERHPTLAGPRLMVVCTTDLQGDWMPWIGGHADVGLAQVARKFGDRTFDLAYLVSGPPDAFSRLTRRIRAQLVVHAKGRTRIRLRDGRLIVVTPYRDTGPDVVRTLEALTEIARGLTACSPDPVERAIDMVRRERSARVRLGYLHELHRTRRADPRVVQLATDLLADGDPACRLAGAHLLGRADTALTVVEFRLASRAVRGAAGRVVAEHGTETQRIAAARALTDTRHDPCAALAVPLLAPLSPEAAEPLLLELLHVHPSVPVVARLGEIGTSSAIPALNRIANHPQAAGRLANASRSAVARIRKQVGAQEGGLSFADPGDAGHLSVAEPVGGELAAAIPLDAMEAIGAAADDPTDGGRSA